LALGLAANNQADGLLTDDIDEPAVGNKKIRQQAYGLLTPRTVPTVDGNFVDGKACHGMTGIVTVAMQARNARIVALPSILPHPKLSCHHISSMDVK